MTDMKIVINKCYGGFGLSDEAYEWLAKNEGVKIQKYHNPKRGEDGLYEVQPLNDGEVIFDRELSPLGESRFNDIYHEYKASGSTFIQRYWDSWTGEQRTDERIVRCVEALGKKADGSCASLSVVEIPDGIDWEIDEYDGIENVREKSRSWG